MQVKRRLGSQGLEVSALGLGCLGMSQSYGTPDDRESIATIHRAVELGVTLFDTAEAYGPFKNEELLGRALEGKRSQVVIATKFGWRIQDGRVNGVDSRPEHVKEVAEASLRRLGTDHIDLLYQHRIDPQVPIEDTVGAMAGLIREGKVRFLGLSEAGEANIRRAHATHPISALQSEYSLWERNLELEIIPLIRESALALYPLLRWVEASWREAPSAPRNTRRTTGGLATRVFRAKISTPICVPPPPSASWPRRRAQRRPKSHWHGCFTKATTSCPFPERSVGRIWKKMLVRLI